MTVSRLSISGHRSRSLLVGNYAYSQEFAAITNSSNVMLAVYPFAQGFGTKYADPVTTGISVNSSVAFSTTGTEIVIGSSNSPGVVAYAWDRIVGFGAKLAAPSTVAGQITDVVMHPSNTVVAGSSTSTPYVHAYAWSSGFGTKFANPSTLPSGTCQGISFVPDASAILVASTASSPYMVHAYSWSGAGFGTKFANPGTTPSTDSWDVTVNSTGTYAVFGLQNFVQAYAWSGAGFGTRYSVSGTGQYAYDVAFSHDDTAIAVASYASATSTAAVWRWSNTTQFGTRYSDPASPPSGANGVGVRFSYDSTRVMYAMGSGSSVWAISYAFSSASGFGTRYADVPPANAYAASNISYFKFPN